MVGGRFIRKKDPLGKFNKSLARERLLSILEKRTIFASPMPTLPSLPRAVCFSECIWEGLIALADNYSPYGVVLSKRLVFNKGGGPALYVRGDHVKMLGKRFPPQLAPFLAPFDPNGVLKRQQSLGYLYEREWRLDSDLKFDYGDVQFVLVKSLEDAWFVVNEIGKKSIPADKLIPIDVYRTIKNVWEP